MRIKALRRPALGVLAALLTALPAAAADTPSAASPIEETAERPRAGNSAFARRPDERRPATSTVISLFGQDIRLSGEHEITHESRLDFDFDEFEDRDRAKLGQELKLEAMFAPTAHSTVFLQLVGLSDIETLRQHGPLESSGTIERGQMWLYLERPAGLPFDLQLGNLSLVESRSWWWDDDLDAVRVFAGGDDWMLETGISQRLMPVSTDERGIDPEAEQLARWFGRAAWAWRKRHTLEAYWLVARDGSPRPAPGTVLHQKRADESDAHLNWLGLRAIGEERSKGGHRIGYWLDLASLSGSEKLTGFDDGEGNRVVAEDSERQRVSAIGWDVGARWSFPGESRPTLWAGWAVGSGDRNDDDGVEHSFRQTGLEENKGRFGGVKRFRYYGELMRPTLSNLDIRSLGASLRFWNKSSVDLVVHDYRQRQASDSLADNRLDQDPTGLRRGLGQEVDLFLAFRESPTTEYTLSLATFRSGPAFGERSGEQAWFVELGMTLNF